MRGMQASNYLRRILFPGASQCSKSGQRTQVHVPYVLNNSEQALGRSSPVSSCDGRRARPLMEGPQSSEEVLRQRANLDTDMDPEVEAHCLPSTFASSLLVVVSRGPRSQRALEPTLCFLFATRHESTSCPTYFFHILIYSGFC